MSLKKLPERIAQELKSRVEAVVDYEWVRYWCQDESRFGLHTETGRVLTAPGVKPVGEVQWRFQAFWLYGAVEPMTGESYFWEFSHLDSRCFEQYLEQFAAAYPRELHVMQVDGAGAHRAGALKVPEIVILLFQPAYSPQVNPIERCWEWLKSGLKWLTCGDLEELREQVRTRLQLAGRDLIASLTGWWWLIDQLSVSGL
ncbi:IS630 family transposase [Rubidibacter lacunae]|nr:IS630 family transposase [Rubidibacter lacunae]